MGIEPTAQAWEAWVLPLYDARESADFMRVHARMATEKSSKTWFFAFALAGLACKLAPHDST